MNILGISAFYHDSAACLLQDGNLIAAAQEERFTRKKHDPDFPSHAIEYCLSHAGISIEEVDHVIFYDKPFLKFERILETHLAFAPKGIQAFMKAIPVWIADKLWVPSIIEKHLGSQKSILFAEHHESHAASAFFPSPFDSAAILTIDGVGEWATSSFGRGHGNKIEIDKEINFPHSLGLLYSAFTYFTGFRVNSGEYKVMGLAPYGEPKYVQQIYDHLLDLKDDGSFSLNQEYFDYCAGLRMTNKKMSDLFGGPPRQPESNLSQREMDLARSVQDVTEEVVLRMAKHVHETTGEKNLCLAGGVALNCVANGKLLRSGIFDDIWIQPAAGDAGCALGAAYVAHYHYLDNPAPESKGRYIQKGSYVGPSYSNQEIGDFLASQKIPATLLTDEEFSDRIAQLLVEGNVIGWFQGRMEFGPRALGARSIIGDARSPEMQKKMNLKIKYRESFRPFAPSVLAEKASDWFEIDSDSPYMLIVADVKKDKQKEMSNEEKELWGIDKLNVIRSEVPAVTHVDYSARVQSVHKETNPRYHALIEKFDEKTGCPVIVNTSFNVRGEPIVESPDQAYTCFMRTEMDVLVMENYLLLKTEQTALQEDTDWREQYELD